MEARILPRRRGSIATGADLLSDSQLTAIAVIPMITATLSLIGSTCIVYIIIRRKRGDSFPPEVETSSSNGVAVRRKSLQSMQQPKRRMHTYHRLLLAMSVADILNSAWLMLGPLPNIRETGILFASGNTATCAAAGFFFHLGFSVMYYNISLMLYYVMVIRFGIKQQVISRIEPFMHIISIGKPLVEGIIGLSYDAFNPWAYTGCYFAIYPPFCDKGDGKPCTRGRLARLFNLIFTLGPQFAFVATFYVCVAFICSSVNKQARRASRIAINDGPVLRKRAVVTQSILYSLVFVNTHIWFFIAALIGLFAEKVVSLNRVLYKLVVLASIFYPAQGFFIFLIFIRPRYQRLQIAFPHKSWLWVLRYTVLGTEGNVGYCLRPGSRHRRRRETNEDCKSEVLPSDGDGSQGRNHSMELEADTNG